MDILVASAPKHSRDIIGNRIQIKKIRELLGSLNGRVLAIIGPDGCGKTMISRLLFEEENINVLDVHNSETIAIMKTFLSNKTIESFVSNKKKMIFVDNIDVLCATERGVIKNLQDCLKENNAGIVCTCNYQTEKTLTEAFKKNLEIVKINYPPIKDSFIYVCSFLDGKNIPYDDEKVLELVTKHRGSIRDTIINLKQSENEIAETGISNTFRDYNIFETTKALYAKPHSTAQIDYIVPEASMVSFVIYENFPEEIYYNYNTKFMESYAKLNEYYIYSNIIENNMYKTMDWSLYSNIQYQKLAGFNAILGSLERKKNGKDVKYRFSQVLSKLSHKNIMNAKLQEVSKHGLGTLDIVLLCEKAGNTKYNKDDAIVISTFNKYFASK